MEYFVLKSSAKGGFAVLKYLENVENSYDVDKGCILSEQWPENACFHMNEEYPSAIKIPDSFSNLDGMLVVSDKYKKKILEEVTEKIEFLPVTIYNHKAIALDSQFYILNSLEVVDCIDMDQSKIKWNNIDKTKISSCLKLVLKDNVLENTPALFRLKHMSEVVLIREDLADKLEDEEIMGLRLVEIDEF